MATAVVITAVLEEACWEHYHLFLSRSQLALKHSNPGGLFEFSVLTRSQFEPFHLSPSSSCPELLAFATVDLANTGFSAILGSNPS